MVAALLRGLRAGLAVAAGIVVVASFAWVSYRPWRQDSGSTDRIQLTVMHWAGGGGQREEQIVDALIKTFERKHPSIRVKRINPGDAASFYTKLQTMMAAGEPPDVFYLGSERLAGFAGKGVLQEIEPLVQADIAAGRTDFKLEDFYKATVDCFRFDGTRTGTGTLYGVPKDFTSIGFYYNKTLFDQAGVPYPGDDWTWDEFAEKARAIGKLKDCKGAHIVVWPAMIRAYLWTYGWDVTSEDFRTINIENPEVLAALERLRAWRFDEENTITSGRTPVVIEESVFMSGNVGMTGPFGRWVVPTYRTIDSFEWDFAPLPRGTQRANAVFTVAWSIARKTQHLNEAWELVRHLTSPEGQAEQAISGLAIPTLRSVAESDVFIDPKEKPDRDRSYLVAAEYASSMHWPANQKFEARLKGRLEEALRSGTLTVPQAAAQFARDWRDELSTPLARTDYPIMPWLSVALWILFPLAALLLVLAWVWWRNRLGPLERREEIAGFCMVSPWVIGFAAFIAFPVVLSLLLAFTRWSGMTTLSQAQWVGLANFRQMLFYDDRFQQSLVVTLYYAAIAVPFGQIFALMAAVLMNQKVGGISFFRSAWYLPSVLAGVGVAVLWRWVFDGDHGLLNSVLRPMLGLIGMQPPQWLNEDAEFFGPPAFAIMSFWSIGGSMMIYLAGLNGIPQDLYEAARIDGARSLQRLRNVTLPMLSPVIFFNVIMAIIGSFQVFVQSYVMTAGGPGDATRFYVLYLFNQAFDFHEMGYASAMAWLLLIIILTLTLVVMRGSKRFVYYEALR